MLNFLDEPHLIMIDGWRKISFFLDGEYRHIPTERMINDLLIPPTPMSGWGTLPPDIFDDISEDDLIKVNTLIQEVSEIFDSSDASWKEIKKCMLQQKYRILITGVLESLYREVALRFYRIPLVDDADSIQALQEFSNNLVLNLTKIINEMQSQERPLFETHFTTEDYKYYMYVTLVECYCQSLLPCPINKILNRHKDYKLFNALQDTMFYFQADQNGAARDVLKTQYACYSRFTDWRWTRETIIPMLNSKIIPDSAFLESFKKYQNDGLYESIKENRKAQDGDRSGEYTKLLYQCLICYRFRLEDRKPNGNRDQCCGRDECKKRLNAFSSHLKALSGKASKIAI
jgi:hypothetical protein